jgi:hypothetical protein
MMVKTMGEQNGRMIGMYPFHGIILGYDNEFGSSTVSKTGKW